MLNYFDLGIKAREREFKTEKFDQGRNFFFFLKKKKVNSRILFYKLMKFMVKDKKLEGGKKGGMWRISLIKMN